MSNDPPRGDEAKAALRRETWNALREAGAARFPGARGRIPNFTGAERAAERLATLPEWKRAARLKVNPDSPQRPVRHRALKEGKIVYMPAPRLASERPFYELDPAALGDGALWKASSIKGAAELGRPVGVDEIEPLDLIVTGCVAVSRRGGRLGKGGGFSDLEYAMLREVGLVAGDTPIATTVHSVQVVDARALPMRPHDISVDIIATEDEVIRARNRPERPSGVLWNVLDDEKCDAIPVLRRRKPE